MPMREMSQQARSHFYFSVIFQPIFGYCCLTAGYTCAPAHTMHFGSEEVTGQDVLLFKAAFSLGLFLFPPFSAL